MNSPTSRSLALLRKEGWLAAVVERWNPYAKVRQDLFGFVDIVAVKNNEVLLVQATTAVNVPARIAKIRSCPYFAPVSAPDCICIEVHGWSKRGPRGKRKVWQVRRENITEYPF